jgi:hypothetical protein
MHIPPYSQPLAVFEVVEVEELSAPVGILIG